MNTWIPLLVPAEDYAELAAEVHERVLSRGLEITDIAVRLSEDASATTAPADGDPTGLMAWPSWSEEALRHFADSDVTTVQRWVRAMDVVAADDTKIWFTTSEIANRSGMTITEWRDAPRKISRHLAKHYVDLPVVDGAAAWPLKAHSFSNTEVSWAMAPITKALWRKIRGL